MTSKPSDSTSIELFVVYLALVQTDKNGVAPTAASRKVRSKHTKMNRTILLLSLLVIIPFTFYSCGCSCQCYKQLGCKILTVKNSGGGIVITKTFCSTTNYYTDKIFKDSITSFYAQYTSSSTIVSERDSLKEMDRIMKIKCYDTQQFESRGYDCSCAK